jgi:hypothetical protein
MYNFIDKSTLYKNRISVSITLFIAILFLIHYFKPNFIYNNDGSFMQLGVGYSNKTIFPIWLIVIIVALLSYISVMYITHLL